MSPNLTVALPLAEERTLSSAWSMVRSTLLRRSYPSAPVSDLYLMGRRHDFTYQQEVGGTTTKRHHVRFWRMPPDFVLPGGYRSDWLAAGTYDRAERFHDIIAWSSGNALFGYIIDSLSGIMDGTAIGIDYPSHRRQAILKAHVEIFDALKARDPQESEARMREHIDAYERYAARKFPQVLKETIPWEQRYFA